MQTDIVLIDDNENHLETAAHLFAHYGLKTRTLSEPSLAIEFISKLQPKIILLDIMMPGIDGFSLLKEIKANTDIKHIPVIILSGKVFPPEKKRALRYGAEKFLTKPISSSNLMEEIKPYAQV